MHRTIPRTWSLNLPAADAWTRALFLRGQKIFGRPRNKCLDRTLGTYIIRPVPTLLGQDVPLAVPKDIWIVLSLVHTQTMVVIAR